MASLRDQFEPYYTPSADAIDTALRTGLVALDTNVLLSLYRLQPLARDELFSVLEKLGDQLWIPHQVALEFHQRRLDVIAEQERFFDKARDDFANAATEYIKKFRTFSKRIGLPDVTVQKLVSGVQSTHEAVQAEVASAEAANEIHLDRHNSDEVLARLEALFANRVGDPMDDVELEETKKEAKRRIEAKIPPGYMDRGKSDPSGDYILWKQLLKEAAERRLPVMLITDDRKEDWFRREQGLTLGPRIQLCEELRHEAGVSFFLMTTETFLIQAKEYLSAPVSSATVSQAKELQASISEEHYRTAIEEHHQILNKLIELKSIRDTIRRRLHINNEIVNANEKTLKTMMRQAEENAIPDEVWGELPEEERRRLKELERIWLDTEMMREDAERIDKEIAMLSTKIRSGKVLVPRSSDGS